MYYSGASWEYVKPDGSPGLGLFTSLAHPWGAAPSYVLPEYLLGIEATEAGYQTFTLRPMVVYLGLEEVSGRVPTPNSPIKSSWIMGANGTVVDIVVQEGLQGYFQIPGGWSAVDVCEGCTSVELACGRSQILLRAQYC
jgi:hypothetical protein